MKTCSANKLFLVVTLTIVLLALSTHILDAQTGVWTNRASLPTPRQGAASCVLSNKLYVFGGEYQMYGYITNRNEVFDPLVGSWSSKALMPQALYGPGAVAAQNQIFLIGGRPAAPPYLSVSNVSCYNPATDTWSAKASMSIARDSLVVAQVNGLVYAIGGYDQGKNIFLNQVEVYNPALNAWTLGPSMSTPRSGAAGAVIGSTIYVFGGNNLGYALSSVEAFDTTTGTWTTKASLPTARYGHAATVLNGLIYVTGGICSTEVDIYYPALDKWFTGVSTPFADATSGMAMGSLGFTGTTPDAIVVAGGEHVNCSGGGYLTGATVSLTPATIFDIHVYAGLTLTGPVGSTNRIDYKNSLNAANWTTLGTLVLPSSPYLFIDTTSGLQPQRFYRAVPQ